jgi:hypothetical protein
MGEQLGDDYTFQPRVKYPWDTWLDGTKWRIRSDTHFPGVKVGSMCRHIRTTAKERGKRVRIVREKLPLNADGSLIATPGSKDAPADTAYVDCLCLQAFADTAEMTHDGTPASEASPAAPTTVPTPITAQAEAQVPETPSSRLSPRPYSKRA